MSLFSKFQSSFFCAFVAFALMQPGCSGDADTIETTTDEDTVTITPDTSDTADDDDTDTDGDSVPDSEDDDDDGDGTPDTDDADDDGDGTLDTEESADTDDTDDGTTDDGTTDDATDDGTTDDGTTDDSTDDGTTDDGTTDDSTDDGTTDDDTTDDATDDGTTDDGATEEPTPTGNAGDLDASFGTSGVTTYSFGDDATSSYTDDYATAAAQTSDGNIVVVGYTSTSSGDKDAAILLLDENGAVLSSDTINLGDSNDEFLAVAVSSTTVYAVGKSGSDIAIVRYNILYGMTLATDVSFGSSGTGIVLTDLGSSTDYGYDVYVGTNGKILVAGYTNVGGTGDFLLARYTTAGILDTTFGGSSTGYITTDLGSSLTDTVQSMAIDTRARTIYLGGYTATTMTNGISDFAIARYNLLTGALDTTFGGGDGIETLNLGATSNGTNEQAKDIALLDRKVILSGSAAISAKSVFATACYDTTAAALDTSFGGGDGIVTSTGVWSYNSSSKAVVVDSQDNIVLGGSYSTLSGSTASASGFALIRYDSTGAADTAFGTSGTVTTNIGSDGDYIEDLVIDSSDDIIAVGKTMNTNGHNDIAVVKYHGSAF